MIDLTISDNCFYDIYKNIITIEALCSETILVPAFKTSILPIDLEISLCRNFTLNMIREDYTIERIHPLVMYEGDKKYIILKNVEFYNPYDEFILLEQGEFVTYLSLTLE
jgi:hypothetical protein